MIYKSNNEDKSSTYKEELLSSIYELGPNLEKGKSTINPAMKSFLQ
jgi:hypothetical protein